jgi:hypothetical protein
MFKHYTPLHAYNPDYNPLSNCSVGLRTCCADRKKTNRLQAKIPSTKLILIGFLLVTMKVLNSYSINNNS